MYAILRTTFQEYRMKAITFDQFTAIVMACGFDAVNVKVRSFTAVSITGKGTDYIVKF